MRTLFFSILIPLLLVAPLTAETGAEADWPSLEELTGHLSPSQRADLAAIGEIVNPIEEDILLTLTPGGETGELERLRSKMDRSYGIETLLFFPVQSYGDPNHLKLSIYNILRRVGTLEGAEYYSVSKKRRRVLFNQFFAIANRESRIPLSDPVYTEIPDRETFLIFQEDSTFGESVHRMRYWVDEKSISLSMENLDPLKLLFFTVADPGELLMMAQVVPTEEGILFYGLCQAEGGGVPGMKDRTAQSLGNRVKALFEWFARNSHSL